MTASSAQVGLHFHLLESDAILILRENGVSLFSGTLRREKVVKLVRLHASLKVFLRDDVTVTNWKACGGSLKVHLFLFLTTVFNLTRAVCCLLRLSKSHSPPSAEVQHRRLQALLSTWMSK